MTQDRDTDNPYQSPCVEEAARKPGIVFRRSGALDLAVVGGVRGSVIGATIGGGTWALLRGCVVLWTQFHGSRGLGVFEVVETVLSETVGFFAGGAILGAVSGLLVGTALGLIAGRSGIRFRGRLVVLSATMCAASGLGWSALLGLTTLDESHAWHAPFPILAMSIVILTAALGGVWLAVKVADAAWGRGDLGSLPKAEAKS
jgi:hypothetical protein